MSASPVPISEHAAAHPRAGDASTPANQTTPDSNVIHAGQDSKQPPKMNVDFIHGFLWIGVVGISVHLLGTAGSKLSGGFSRVGAVAIMLITGVVVAGWAWSRARRARTLRDASAHAVPATVQPGRIRVVGPTWNVAALLASMPAPDKATQDADGFEPFIQRLVLGLTFARAGAAQSSKRTGSVKHEWRMSIDTNWMGVLVLVGFGVALYMLLWALLGTWPSINVFTIWAIMGGALACASIAKPAFVRIAPGVLDVFESGWLGIGPLRMKRYDLRRASVYIDLKQGIARIEDPMLPSQGEPESIVQIRPSTIPTFLGWLQPKGAFECWRTLLLASTSTAPTPPLPEDALIG